MHLREREGERDYSIVHQMYSTMIDDVSIHYCYDHYGLWNRRVRIGAIYDHRQNTTINFHAGFNNFQRDIIVYIEF